MVIRFSFLLALFLLVSNIAWPADPADRYMSPITSVELVQSIQKTAITSKKNHELILRAKYSGLAKIAYNQYKQRLKGRERNGYAHLWFGIAANTYREDSMNPFRKRAAIAEANTLMNLTHTHLLHAAEMLPDSAIASTEYGYFLWQYGNQMNKGLLLMRKAADLSPNDPFIHARLGSVYSNASGNAYNVAKAEKELELATKTDPTFAYPHWIRTIMHINLKRYEDARQSLDKFLGLAPPNYASRPSVVHIQSVLTGKHR